MSDDLSIQGTLADTTVPDLVRSMIRSGESGTVSLESAGRHDNIYFAEGRIVFATSSNPDLGLAEVLFRLGDLDLPQYLRASEELYSTRRAGPLLVELGFLQQDELPLAMEKQVSAIVVRALGFRGGGYTVDFSGELPFEGTPLPLNTDRLILDGVSRIENWSLISRGIGRMERMLGRTAAADAKLFHLELTEEENHVFGLLSEPAPVSVLCERSYLPNFVTCRVVWALLTVNLLEDAAEDEAGKEKADAQSELELEWLAERYNDAFQSIFALVFQKIGDHTYDFADRVAMHVSPGMMPYLNGINLLNEGRIDFDQLLNNLFASGSADRHAVVRQVMNELLQGWTTEIRREFGAAFDKDVARIVSALK